LTDDHAAVLLRGNHAGKAIEVLAAAAPYELGGVVETFHFVRYPFYLRGKAYPAKQQGASTGAEFQKIIDHPGVVWSQPIGALARLELGRAFVMSGD
jgi:eukaryotic-like serine/threonine-protein kinase